MCSIRGKAGGSRVLMTAVALPACCGPGQTDSPCQVAVSMLPPWINLSPWCVPRAARCPSRRAPTTQRANPFLSLPPTSPRVNGNRRWAAEMPVNKAQLLRGRRSKDKNENKSMRGPGGCCCHLPQPQDGNCCLTLPSSC